MSDIKITAKSGANLTGEERAHYVQDMFSRIAFRYDLMNRLMTAGQDVRWRQEVIGPACPRVAACLIWAPARGISLAKPYASTPIATQLQLILLLR